MMILPSSHAPSVDISNPQYQTELVKATIDFLLGYNKNDVKTIHNIKCPLCSIPQSKEHAYCTVTKLSLKIAKDSS